MKAIVFALIAQLGFSSAEAALRQDGFQLKIDFSYRQEDRKIQLSSNVLIAANSEDWTPITSKDGVTLLAKVSSAENEIVQAEYMVIDTNVTPIKMNRMKVNSRLREQSEIKSETDKDSVRVSLIAIPTRVTAD